MTCAAFDLACHFSGLIAPAVDWWNSAVLFIQTWFPLGTFIAGLILGALMGRKMVLGVLTVGIGLVLYNRLRQPSPEPSLRAAQTSPPSGKRRKPPSGT